LEKQCGGQWLAMQQGLKQAVGLDVQQLHFSPSSWLQHTNAHMCTQKAFLNSMQNAAEETQKKQCRCTLSMHICPLGAFYVSGESIHL
jgi:Fe-S-cluster-containing hydrogenase component 2